MKISQLPDEKVNSIIEIALAEDVGRGDITSEALIPCSLEGKAFMLVKEAGVLAGSNVAEKTLHKVDPALKVDILIQDGSKVKSGDIVMLVAGNVRSMLKAERVALNFIQRMSGIATATAEYVEKVKGLGVDIADTRKTTPGLRLLEKYAVSMGGGRNHRLDLGEAVLIKDNHIDALRILGMTFKEIVTKAKENTPPNIKIEVETRTVEEATQAVELGVDIIMLDNMNIDEMSEAVELISGRAEVEASGGITLKNVRDAAQTGVDFISVGALTHSFKSLDISLELETQTLKLL
jgi:nicotinate-nucleotide pyrophosphorylase (carboxylating)